MRVFVIGSWNKWGMETVLCQRHSFISITHMILISSLGFIPGEQLILNNSSLCRRLSSNHLEAGIRNACTESEPMSHHSQATLLDHTSPKNNLKSLKILISNLQSLLAGFVTKDASKMTYLIYLHKTLIHFSLPSYFHETTFPKKKKLLLFSWKNIFRLEKSICPMDFFKNLTQTGIKHEQDFLPMWRPYIIENQCCEHVTG